MKRIVDAKHAREHTAPLEIRGDRLQDVGGTGKSERARAVDGGYGDDFGIGGENLLGLFQRNPDGKHASLRRGELHAATAMADDTHGVLEGQRPAV